MHVKNNLYDFNKEISVLLAEKQKTIALKNAKDFVSQCSLKRKLRFNNIRGFFLVIKRFMEMIVFCFKNMHRLCVLKNSIFEPDLSDDNLRGVSLIKKINSRYLLNSSRARAYTDCARKLKKISLRDTVYLAREAYILDPQCFRLKWFAFRLFEAGYVLEAEAFVSILPLTIKYSSTEAQMVNRIRSESCVIRYRNSAISSLEEESSLIAECISRFNFIGENTFDDMQKIMTLEEEFFTTFNCISVLVQITKQNVLTIVPEEAAILLIVFFLEKLINHPEWTQNDSEFGNEDIWNLLKEVSGRVNINSISSSIIPYNTHYYKVGIGATLKECLQDLHYEIVVKDYDSVKNEVLLTYCTSFVDCEEVTINGIDCIPTVAKTTRDDLCGHTFVLRRHLWISFVGHQHDDFLNVSINGVEAQILFKNTFFKKIQLKEIINYMVSSPVRKDFSPFEGCWIFLDRDLQADDNAEHLYRYIQRNKPDINAYFALRTTSHDWDRLENNGFKLLPWGTPTYDEALQRCAKIISSQANKDAIRCQNGMLGKGQRIFLQHGVIKDDMSRQLNHHTFSLFLTSSKSELNSIIGNMSRYNFTSKTVKCLGLPRHDALLADDVTKKRCILIMPTWRKSLAGVILKGHQRSINKDFIKSNYFKSWNDVLNSYFLYKVCHRHKYKVIFFPHALMQPYLHFFNLPKYISSLTHVDTSIQRIFKMSSVMITDFSSVAFEMAYLRRPVIYYQFDENEFFAGNSAHMQRGYFDYRRDGFGPVVADQKSLFSALELILQQNAVPEKVYETRMKQAFEYRDTNNCQRAFEAICDLDRPYPNNYINIDLLAEYTRMAINAGLAHVANMRAMRLHALCPNEDNAQLLCDAKKLAKGI